MEGFKSSGGKCYLGVSIIADRHNAAHLYDLIKNLKDVGADSVKVSPCIVDNDGLKNNQYHKPVFEKVKDQVKNAIEELSDDKFEIYDSYHELDGKN